MEDGLTEKVEHRPHTKSESINKRMKSISRLWKLKFWCLVVLIQFVGGYSIGRCSSVSTYYHYDVFSRVPSHCATAAPYFYLLRKVIFVILSPSHLIAQSCFSSMVSSHSDSCPHCYILTDSMGSSVSPPFARWPRTVPFCVHSSLTGRHSSARLFWWSFRAGGRIILILFVSVGIWLTKSREA